MYACAIMDSVPICVFSAAMLTADFLGVQPNSIWPSARMRTPLACIKDHAHWLYGSPQQLATLNFVLPVPLLSETLDCA
jgi:hypothetical protein